MTLLDRYLLGESEAVWAELMALGSGYRTILPEATAVAEATMLRVRANLETIRDLLAARGYRFAHAGNELRPLKAEEMADLAKVERLLGPLPLSLRSFYQHVGTVNFMQDTSQCLHFEEEIPGEPWKIENLGRQDPLVVYPPGDLLKDCRGYLEALRLGRIGLPAPGAITLTFAPDEYHKANYSGGENYGVPLPCNAADFEVTGLCGLHETFVNHLRLSLQGGGFRGATLVLDDYSNIDPKPVPTGPLIDELVEGLVGV